MIDLICPIKGAGNEITSMELQKAGSEHPVEAFMQWHCSNNNNNNNKTTTLGGIF